MLKGESNADSQEVGPSVSSAMTNSSTSEKITDDDLRDNLPAPPLNDLTNLPDFFRPLHGEIIKVTADIDHGQLILSNYRLFINLSTEKRFFNIPLGLIEICTSELNEISANCKDARTIKFSFQTNEKCLEWVKKLNEYIGPPKHLKEIFAFQFYTWTNRLASSQTLSNLMNFDQNFIKSSILEREDIFRREVERLQFDTHGAWRITQANTKYELCESYPPLLLVPACITDSTLYDVAKFRSSKRIPAVTWRHTVNGAVIARCSQPEVGWLGWRSQEDENLIKAIADACNYDRGHQINSMANMTLSLESSCPTSMSNNSNDSVKPSDNESGSDAVVINESSSGSFNSTIFSFNNLTHSTNQEQQSSGSIPENKKVLILDCRSYATAVANRARGGGCEYIEYYQCCDIEFMSLANIHAIRKSFLALRSLCASSPSSSTWLSTLENTRWLHHISLIINAATILVTAIEKQQRPVMVHCSDGWDRTPQIVALGQLLLDPYYRTMKGFRILVEKEWLDFGHKFGDRCGHEPNQEDQNERCPVFLQWLDCVHQILNQFPCHFEFSHLYLVKLAQHTYSNLFGTFLCNSRKVRDSNSVSEQTFDVWHFLSSHDKFKNHFYLEHIDGNSGVIWPSCNLRDLRLWTEMYLGSLENDQSNMDIVQDMLLKNDNENLTNFVCEDNNLNLDNNSSKRLTNKTQSYSDLASMVNARIFTSMELNGQTSSTDNAIPSRRLSDPNLLSENHCISTTKDTTTTTTLQKIEIINKQMDNLIMQANDDVDSQIRTNDEESYKCKAKSCQNDVNNENWKTGISDNMAVSLDECCQSAFKKDFLKKHLEDNSIETSTETIVINDKINTRKTFSENEIADLNNAVPDMQQWDNDNGELILKLLYDDDGLTQLNCKIQNRLKKIIDENQSKIELLEKELQLTRLAVIQRICHKCCPNNPSNDNLNDEIQSIGGSICSTEGRMSANESDVSSWEAVDEPPVISRTIAPNSATLWMPDYAVTKCNSCQTEFWLGRRKHHCRCCGNIFCADCSKMESTLPFEQQFLQNPVRVCIQCYNSLNFNIDIPEPNHRSNRIAQQTTSQKLNKPPTYAQKVKNTLKTNDDCQIFGQKNYIKKCLAGDDDFKKQNSESTKHCKDFDENIIEESIQENGCLLSDKNDSLETLINENQSNDFSKLNNQTDLNQNGGDIVVFPSVHNILKKGEPNNFTTAKIIENENLNSTTICKS